MRWGAALVALALATVPAMAQSVGEWRRVATPHDRQRLRDWRTAWVAALDQAHGDGAATIAADPVLYAPDAALVDRPAPPPGDYRCRRIGVGVRPGRSALVVEPWGRCRIEGRIEGQGPWRLTALDGSQRPVGMVYPDGDRRAVFLGTTMFPEEHRPAPYGHAAGRDMVGAMERIGEARWRLVLPYPRFGAALDLIELVPA